MLERVTVDVVTVAEEIGRRSVVWESVHDLLRRPCGRRVFGHVEVEDAPAMVGKHDEDEQHAEVHGSNSEEIDRDQVLDVVGQEGAPRLVRWSPGALGH